MAALALASASSELFMSLRRPPPARESSDLQHELPGEEAGVDSADPVLEPPLEVRRDLGRPDWRPPGVWTDPQEMVRDERGQLSAPMKPVAELEHPHLGW